LAMAWSLPMSSLNIKFKCWRLKINLARNLPVEVMLGENFRVHREAEKVVTDFVDGFLCLDGNYVIFCRNKVVENCSQNGQNAGVPS